MGLPFTVEQFYGVFRDHNTAGWPAQWFLAALAIAALAAVLWPRPWSSVAVSAVLSAAAVGMGLLATAGQRPRTFKP